VIRNRFIVSVLTSLQAFSALPGVLAQIKITVDDRFSARASIASVSQRYSNALNKYMESSVYHQQAD
jgi:hypothetical protein